LSPNIEVRHLHAVSALAETLNVTRAAERLHISQSALSKQIKELESGLGVQLFVRQKKKITDLTEPGRAFVQEARTAVIHAERAIHIARSVDHGAEAVLAVGHSPYADRKWIKTMQAVHLPMFPNLRLLPKSRMASELVSQVINGELHLALVTAPPKNPNITASRFARNPLYVALPERHRCSGTDSLFLRNLDGDLWGLFAETANPLAYRAVMNLARREGIAASEIHEVMMADDAFSVVTEHGGIAFVSQATALKTSIDGVVFKALGDESLRFETCVVTRAEEELRLVNQFAKALVIKLSHLAQPEQMSLGEIA
jgi:DNA-binding transcriptional LysR family regulator